MDSLEYDAINHHLMDDGEDGLDDMGAGESAMDILGEAEKSLDDIAAKMENE